MRNFLFNPMPVIGQGAEVGSQPRTTSGRNGASGPCRCGPANGEWTQSSAEPWTPNAPVRWIASIEKGDKHLPESPAEACGCCISMLKFGPEGGSELLTLSREGAKFLARMRAPGTVLDSNVIVGLQPLCLQHPFA